MLIYLIVKIIAFIVCLCPVKPDQFIGFIFNTYIKISTGSIGKSGNTFQPAYDILTIQSAFAFKFITFQFDIFY